MNIQQFALRLGEKESRSSLSQALQALCTARREQFLDSELSDWIPWAVNDPPGVAKA
jgi:hypothetical protein